MSSQFISPTRGKLSVSQMVKDISAFVQNEPSDFYRLVIGTDSQAHNTNGQAHCDFVTAIVIHRKGKGAKYFWSKEKQKPMHLRDKIYTETQKSLDTAEKIVPSLRKAVNPAKYDLEIHIDVGSLGPTREMIKEVVGMVNGNGFTAKTKPESWAASSVADRHT
jgi:hypothetical protein